MRADATTGATGPAGDVAGEPENVAGEPGGGGGASRATPDAAWTGGRADDGGSGGTVRSDGAAELPGVTPEAARAAIRRARGALARYRFMAILTGTMLLILCAELVLKYLLHADDVVRFIAWVPFAHGWIYVVYLLTVGDLWSKMRWGWGRGVALVFAGVIPVMSFVLERRAHAEADATLSALAQHYRPA